MNQDERPKADSELPTVPRPAEATGQTIAGVRVLQKVGEGGMGVVYEAERLWLSGGFCKEPSRGGVL